MRRIVHTSALGLVLMFAVGARAQGQKRVEFSRERIQIAVADGGIAVRASYVFSNDAPAPQRQVLFYPFPVDSLHPFPDSVDVDCDGRSIPFREQGSGLAFSVDVPARGEAVLHVFYHQPSADRSACYILTTTSKWNAPLRVARYEITVPDSLELAHVSWPVDDVMTADGVQVHVIDRENFLPDHDLCVEWRRAASPQR